MSFRIKCLAEAAASAFLFGVARFALLLATQRSSELEDDHRQRLLLPSALPKTAIGYSYGLNWRIDDV